MIVRFEGERPADESAWIDVLYEALGEEARSFWVRFYREPGGWRFDLECRSESGSYGPNGKVAGVGAWGSRRSFVPADESVALRVYTLLVESGKPLDPGWRPFAPSPRVAIVRTPALTPPEPDRETKTEPVGTTLPASLLQPGAPLNRSPPPPRARLDGGVSGLPSSSCPRSCWSHWRGGSPGTGFGLAPSHHPCLRPPPR